jgi:uncharacterized membrane protein
MTRGRLILAIVAVAILHAGPAWAAPASVTIDDPAPALTERDGGGWTVALGFTNLTTDEIGLAAEPAEPADAGCQLTLDKSSVPGASHLGVTVTIAAGCAVAEDGIDFIVDATDGRETSLGDFEVTAAPKPDTEDPNWSALKVFPIALGVLAVLGGILYLVWDARDSNDHRITETLKHLDASWTFKDNWVSNVTVAGGLITGIFGSSEVVKAILGEDSDRSIALATVGAAIALAFIGAAPLVLMSTKKRTQNAKDAITVYGLLFAAVVTLTGAYGELYVVVESGSELDLGGWESKLWIVGVVAALLLALYSVRTIIATLEQGTTKPPKPGPSDAILAATMIAKALQADSEETLNESLQDLRQEYPRVKTGPGTGPGDEYLPPRRTALL